MEELYGKWKAVGAEYADVADFFPIRAVTIIEVFTRSWIATLIDRGSPYADRGVSLTQNISFKTDFSVVASVQSKAVTFGQIVGHSITLSQIGQVVGVLDKILGCEIKPKLATVKSIFTSEIEDPNVPCVVPDVDGMLAKLSLLFQIRHILCHEIPAVKVYDPADLEGILAAATEFVAAVEAILTLEENPNGLPMTQAEMTQNAWKRLRTGRYELAGVLRECRSHGFGRTQRFRRFSLAWRAYIQSYYSEQLSMEPFRGTSAPMIDAYEELQIVEEQARVLRAALNHWRGMEGWLW